MIPDQLGVFMYALMKEARRDSLYEFLEEWGISKKEYEGIEKWFEDLGIEL